MRGRALALGACIVAGLFAFAGVAIGAPAEMSVTPSLHDFGSVCVGSSTSRSFTISNTANNNDDDLVVGSITQLSPKVTAFTPDDVQPPAEIKPQQSASFAITFSPTSHGLRQVQYRIDPENEGLANGTVTARGTGVDRKITSDRPSVSFGEQRVGTRSPTQSLIIRNPGQDTLSVTNIRKVGANPGDFRVTAPGLPFTVGAGNFVSLTLSFQPTGAGLRNATLELSSNACGKPKLSIPMVGSGAVSRVLVDPNPIDVGSSPLDVQGAPVSVTVANGGGAPLKITAVQVIGTDAEDFVLEDLPTMPATIPAAESFIFHVRMTPTAEGPRVARINILSDDPTAPTFSVDLRGTGGKASPSPTASASASASASGSPSPRETSDTKPQALGTSNDNLAITLVIVAVLLAFLGLVVIRRFIAVSDDDE